MSMTPTELARYVLVATVAKAAGFQGEFQVIAVAITFGESEGKPWAWNQGTLAVPEDSRGLWQINVNPATSWGAARLAYYGDLFDPQINARAAWDISRGGTNFQPWTVYSAGLYVKYMADARIAIAASEQELTVEQIETILQAIAALNLRLDDLPKAVWDDVHPHAESEDKARAWQVLRRTVEGNKRIEGRIVTEVRNAAIKGGTPDEIAERVRTNLSQSLGNG